MYISSVQRLLEAIQTPVNGMQVMRVASNTVNGEARWSRFEGTIFTLYLSQPNIDWEICHEVGHMLECSPTRMLKENMGMPMRDSKGVEELNTNANACLREARACYIQREIGRLFSDHPPLWLDSTAEALVDCAALIDSTINPFELRDMYKELFSTENVLRLWNERRQLLGQLIVNNTQQVA